MRVSYEKARADFLALADLAEAGHTVEIKRADGALVAMIPFEEDAADHDFSETCPICQQERETA